MKKVYIIHGWGMDSNMPWIKWLEQELAKKGFEVHALDMPNTEHPKIEEWVEYLEEHVGSIDEETYFIGHSIGSQTIIRFLEKLPKQKHIKGVVFVAGWFHLVNLEPEEFEIAHPWINNKVDLERIKRHTNNLLAVFSDNDPYVPESEVEYFRDNLGAKIIIKKNAGHFEDIDKIEEVLKFVK